MSGPEEALKVMLVIALAIIAAAGLAVGGAVYYSTGSGLAGLSAMLVVFVAGLAILRFG